MLVKPLGWRMKSWHVRRVLLCLKAGALALMAAYLVGCVPTPLVTDTVLSVFFLDVEQGNCVLVVSPSGTAALVDAGTGRSGDGTSDTDPVAYIRDIAAAVDGFQLRYIVVTHFDADHIGKLDNVLDAQPPVVASDYRIYTRESPPSPIPTSSAYERISDVTPEHRSSVTPGDSIDIGEGAILTCYAADGEYLASDSVQSAAVSASDENARSVAVILSFHDVKMWFGGDLTGVVEEAVAPYLPDVDVYAMDHHGSSGSSSLPFLQSLRPECAICQSGQENNYGHPNREAIDRILSVPSSDGGVPLLLQQNCCKSGDARCDEFLATYVADPDGGGPQPGDIRIDTDGYALEVTWPGHGLALGGPH
jgi:competence protein ComEC